MTAPPEPVEIRFDQAVTELDALQRATYAVARDMTVNIAIAGHEYVCTLFPRGQDADPDELKHRMRAEVNDQTLRSHIARETAPLRNLIFALAFSRTGLTEGESPGDDG